MFKKTRNYSSINYRTEYIAAVSVINQTI